MKFSKRQIVLAAVLVVASSLGGAYAYHNFHGDANAKSADAPEPTPPALNRNGTELVVRAFTIETRWGAAGAKRAFTGTLQPRYQTSMAFRVAGKIAERLVEVGQPIKKGQVLFRLDPEDMELQLRVAEADQISTESQWKQTAAEESRLTKLRSSNSISQSEYDLGLANRDVAKARVDAANRRLKLARNQRTYCDLLADADGLVTAIQAEAGQVVNVGQAVLQLTQTNELEAVVSLPENLISEAKAQNAVATFWSMPSIELPAELRELSPMADPLSRTYDAKFRLNKTLPEMAIGMTVSIAWNPINEDGICIPIASIAARNQSPVVWKIDATSGSVVPVPIEIKEYRNESAVVRGGFQSGDRIVSAGVQRIDEKSKVRVWEGDK